jgi:hypothetical protein
MTTSGVTAWSMTAREHIVAALRDARVIGSGAEPTADELDDSLVRFNGLLKSWSAKANLFRNAELSVTTIGGTASVTLNAAVRDVSAVRHVLSATSHRPLSPWNRTEYFSLPNRTTAGNPSAYYLDRQRDAAVLYLWPVPATAQTLKLDYSRKAETITDASETVDIPEEWQEAVWKNLAVECAEMFGATLSPRYLAKAEMLYQQFLDSDRPDSYYFEAAD